MATSDFDRLPDDARLYIFAASRPLSPADSSQLLAEVDRFLGEWQSHKEEVLAARDWRYDRFLLIGVDETATRLSGCSIDGMMRRLKDLETRLGSTLVDGSAVLYRDHGGEIVRLDRSGFRERVREGRVGSDTTVFNNTLMTVGELRRGLWETAMRNSWHARAFQTNPSTGTGVE
jgi:hypothetical protein